ncbi:MAG: 30S ribosomal protein S21 [Alphaproteobacteria bacterium]
MEVSVQGKNGLEMAIRVFRKKTQKEGLVKESSRRNEFEKPSKKIKRKQDESISRKKKARKGEVVY